MKQHIHTVREFFIRYQRPLASGSLFLGFIIDTLTLRRIDLLSNQLIIVGNLLLLAVGITAINIYQSSVRRSRLIERSYVYLPILIQFAFGNLFSGFMVLYSRSTSLIASWPFLLLLLGLLIGNEMFEPYYLYLKFQSALFFFALLSFFIVYVPLITGTLGPWTFLLSIVVTVIVFMCLLQLLAFRLPALIKEYRTHILSIMGGIIGVILFFYFTNLIPPIPLSLEDGSAFHRVERAGNSYAVTEEVEGRSFLEKIFLNPTIRITPGEGVYVYSSVFAPTRLETTIVHDWQWFDESKGRWIALSGVPFAISGGREGGYRGYSFKNLVPEGSWRVDVETGSGQVIGRIKFNVVYTNTPPPLSTTVR